MFNHYPKISTRPLSATAIVLVASQGASAQVQDCTLVNDVLPEGCVRYDADTVVTVPAGENTEFARSAPVAASGFAISIDGIPVSGDNRLVDKVRRTDVALAAADIQVKFDGLGAKPRLDLLTVGERRVFHTGDRVTFQSQTNYPRWMTRGAVRIIELSERGGPRTIAVLQINPNGQVQYVLPEGKDLVAIHRVYDSKRRYDETYSLALSARPPGDGGDQDGPQASEPEEGADHTARRRIPVHGVVITVSGTSVAPGCNSAGDGRGITGRSKRAFYLKGRTDKGYTITASAGTGEDDPSNLFRNFDERDPRSLLL